MRYLAKLVLLSAVFAVGILATGIFTHSSGISSSDVRGNFVCSPVPVGFGDVSNGRLEGGDCVDTNTALFDGYTFTGTAGQQIEIVLTSAAFAGSLRLVQGDYPGGAVIATGTDVGGGTRRITSFTMPSNGNFTVVVSSGSPGATGPYTMRLEPTIPKVEIIQRTSPNPTTPGSTVGYSVFFNTAVTGVDAADFTLTTSGISGSSITSVSGSGTIYSVLVATGAGVGSLRLDVIDNDTVVNGIGTLLGGPGAGNGSFTTGPSYSIAVSTPTPSPTPPSNAVVVTNTNDDGAGSLRQAISSVLSGGTVTFSPLFNSPQTIVLESELSIQKNLSISGPGPNLLTLSGNNAVRVFNIGGSSPGFTVNISGLKITGGRAPNNDFGGGIEKNFGDLTLTNCIVTGNSVSGNGSFGNGGGIDNFDGPLTITNCIISGNTANGSGGGILNEAGPLTITNTTVSGNAARNGAGIRSNDAAVNITRSTFSSNTAILQGGGIFVQDGNLTITTSTISGNTANSPTAAGAGLFITASSGTRMPRISGCTIANNTAAANAGGGILINGPATGSLAANLRDSIVAGNTEPDLRAINATASIVSQGFNLSNGTGNGFLNQPTDKLNAAAGLAPLANNGGSTQTHALLATSAAIDGGNSSGLVNDQRDAGFSRVIDLAATNATGGDGSDIGAFEIQSEPPPTFATISGRVTTPTGLGLRNAIVVMTDPQGIRGTATTSSFGVFTFNTVPTGMLYILSVSTKRYRFAAQSITVNGNLSNVDFVGLE